MVLELLTSQGSHWPPILPGNRQSEIWSAFLELCRTERRDYRSGQLEQFRSVLRHCYEHVPYYQEVFKGCPAPDQVTRTDCLEPFPILTRRVLASYKEELTANQLPAGHTLLQSTFTAGSTGEPVEVRQTNLTLLWWQAMYLRTLEWADLNPKKKFAAIRYFPPSLAKELQGGLQTPSLEAAFAGFLEASPAYVMDIHVDPAVQLDWLLEVRPDYLVSYPSNLEALAGLNDARGRPLSLEGVLSMSEPLTESTETRLFNSFDCEAANSYSSQEAGYIAGSCQRGGAGLHVFSENVILEIVDDDGVPCGPGETGRVLLTTLQNFAMPLIRYEIGDTACWSETQDCPCGIKLPHIRRPQGKVHPLFRLSDGRLKNSMAIAVGMRKIGGFRQFRVTQRANGCMRVEVVAPHGWKGRREIAAMLNEFLEYPSELAVNFGTYPDRLPLTTGGKSPALVTELGADS